MQKYVYLFSEGNATMRNLLGGKGANLAEMTSLGMPVPQGFTITTEACTRYYEDGKTIGKDIQKQIDEALAKIEAINEKKFGDAKNPLLVSVRSGARASMPGMMDTILNLGINDEVAAGLIAGNPDPKLSASCMTAIAASSRCSPTWSWSSRRRPLRSSSTRSRRRRASPTTSTWMSTT